MNGIHERLARLGLAAIQRYGFVLAGGYALAAHGFGNRPSMDVDLFTMDMSADNFARAVGDLVAAYERDALVVRVVNRGDLFVNMDVRDPRTGEDSEIQLGYDYRELPPARLDIGPVLHERDAVGNKMTALFARGEVRDFIDIDTVIQSGRFNREDVLALADVRESLPIDRRMLAQRFAMLADPRQGLQYGAVQFANYGVDAAARAAIVGRFTEWAAVIDPARASALQSDGVERGAPPRMRTAENSTRVNGNAKDASVRAVSDAQPHRRREDRGPSIGR